MSLDRRFHAFRFDLADCRLQGQIEAQAFVEGEPARIMAASAPVRRAPRFDAPLDTEALCGEPALVFDDAGEGWAWVQLTTDGYVGYVPSDALGRLGSDVDHRVRVLRTFVYPGPSIKLPPIHALSMGANLNVIRQEGDFAVTPLGFVWAAHLAALHEREPDFVGVAERFVGVPYLWGGKTSLGLDCSGLIQVALAACGIVAPRDSDEQEKQLGKAVLMQAEGEFLSLRRGDLVFWKGHVGVMTSHDILLHANGHHMSVAVEPLQEAMERIARKGGGAITSIKRF